MRRLTVFAIAFVALAFGSMSLADAGGCKTPPGTTEGSGTEVKVANCSFGPTILHAPVGAKVTWFNGDFLPHAINGMGWDASVPFSPTYPGTTVSYTFTQPGIYPYMCYVHPGMSGIVVVGDVALNPSADGGPRADAAIAAPPKAVSSTPTVEIPLATALVVLAGLLGYAFSFLRRYRWADGTLAIRRRHGVHAR